MRWAATGRLDVRTDLVFSMGVQGHRTGEPEGPEPRVLPVNGWAENTLPEVIVGLLTILFRLTIHNELSGYWHRSLIAQRGRS